MFTKHPAGKDTAGTQRRIKHSYWPEEVYSLERKKIHRNTKSFIKCIMEMRSFKTAAQEKPELTSFYGHNRLTATYGTAFSEKDPRTT